MPELAICAYCDAVHRRVPIREHRTARCANCGAALYRGDSDVGAMVAVAITAAAGLAVALTAPLLTLQSGNVKVEASLWGAIAAAWEGMPLVGLVLLISLVLAPVCELGLLLWILVPLSAHVRPPGFALAMRILRVLRPWRLVEVFLLGVLVAIVVLLLGLIPLVGGILGPVFGVLLSGRVLARELTGRAFDARDLSPADRAALFRGSRARVLGFGAATQLCFLVPGGAVAVMPAAVAGATVLARSLLERTPIGTTAHPPAPHPPAPHPPAPHPPTPHPPTGSA